MWRWKHYGLLGVFCVCLLPLLGSFLAAQEKCDAEVKLLLSPEENQTAVRALKARGEAVGRVYFFDTNQLDLLSQGVIVRLRQGPVNDLTVKLRPPKGRTFPDPSAGRERYKCEVDVTGKSEVRSYSIQTAYSSQLLPSTGSELLALFSPGQKQFLEQAHAAIDWTHVRRIADIQSTTWQIKSQPNFRKLVLELWKWPRGNVLELSSKVGADAGPSALADLQQLANSKGLSLDEHQGPKTAMVLEEIVRPNGR